VEWNKTNGLIAFEANVGIDGSQRHHVLADPMMIAACAGLRHVGVDTDSKITDVSRACVA
jgi:hypothetical protein